MKRNHFPKPKCFSGRFPCFVFCFAILFLFMSVPGFADEISQAIQEGLQAYEKGNNSEAISQLNYASQLIAQKKGGELETLFPAPLPGWEAEKATSQAAGAAMFGGGISAERSYTKENASIHIQIMTDSPMLQGVMMMLSNPMIAASDGGKLVKVNDQKGLLKYDPNTKDGNLNLVIANRFLITLEGNEVSKNDMMDYAQAIDYKKIAALP